MADITDYRAFANFLLEHEVASGKSTKEIAREIGISIHSLQCWRNGECLPEERRLPAIASAYGVLVAELNAAHVTAREARKKEKAARPRRSQPGRAIDLEVYGSISDLRTLCRSNSQLPHGRYGRQ